MKEPRLSAGLFLSCTLRSSGTAFAVTTSSIGPTAGLGRQWRRLRPQPITLRAAAPFRSEVVMSDKTNKRPDRLAWVAGSDAPEKSALNIGFMALTDSASLVVAATQGFSQPYGLTLNLHRQN